MASGMRVYIFINTTDLWTYFDPPYNVHDRWNCGITFFCSVKTWPSKSFKHKILFSSTENELKGALNHKDTIILSGFQQNKFKF